MRNIEVRREGDKLMLVIDVSQRTLDAAPLSSTGKSLSVASSEGHQTVNGNGLTFNLNVNYKRRK